jgi:ABC-2 type transport system ATP-binding protein
LREKVTIFISTAYLDEAERCHRVGLIHRGRLLACGTPGEVKHLMRGAILEIRLDEPRQAVAVLKKELPDASVGLFGDRIHVVSSDPDRAAADAEHALGRAGLTLTGMQRIEPSLEDVFVSVLTGKDST